MKESNNQPTGDSAHVTGDKAHVTGDNAHVEKDNAHVEKTHLLNQQKDWTRMDKLLLVFGVLMNIGDGVEMYLPG